MTDRTSGELAQLTGSYLTPSFAHARVADAMRAGVISCPPDTPMEAVARIMADNHVHAVVITGLAGDAPWEVVTDRDLLHVAPDAPLAAATELMDRHGVTHLLVGEPRGGRPIGVLSSLDVAGIVAWGRG